MPRTRTSPPVATLRSVKSNPLRTPQGADFDQGLARQPGDGEALVRRTGRDRRIAEAVAEREARRAENLRLSRRRQGGEAARQDQRPEQPLFRVRTINGNHFGPPPQISPR